MPAVSQLQDAYPTDCPHLLAVRAENASRRWHWNAGYICYTFGPSYESEHRLVALRAYGEIPDGYHVHHRDRNRANNAAANLEIISAAEHAKLHSAQTESTHICPVCGTSFHVMPSKSHLRVHCGERCAQLARRKVERPAADSLLALVRDVGNWSALGRMFGVSGNTIRKWVRYYGLDPAICMNHR